MPQAMLLEVGPGQALAGIARACLGDKTNRAAPPLAASLPRANDSRNCVEHWLETLGRLWLAGAPIRWPEGKVTHADQPARTARRRVPLPTYPFERQLFTVPPAADAARSTSAPPTPQASVATAAAPSAHDRAAVPRSAHIDDWFYASTWARDDSMAAPAPADGKGAPRWLVLGDAGPLTDAVSDALASRGLRVLRADASPACNTLEAVGPERWRFRREVDEDLRRLVDTVVASGPLAGIVHLGSLLAGPHAARLCWPLPPADPGYDGLVALACALPERGSSKALRVLHPTCGAESVLGEPVEDPTQAIAVGPALVLPAEMPGLLIRTVDVAAGAPGPTSHAATAAALGDEALLDDAESRVAYRAGLRWVRRYERLSLPADDTTGAGATRPLPIREGGCYLVTGGLGGMGLTIARWLGTRWRARLVLTSRRPLPPREAWAVPGDPSATPGSEDMRRVIETVQAIEAAGGEVMVARADAADEAAMGRALAAARGRFGDLHGVFHAAGLPGRGVVARRASAEAAREVLAPKLGGLHVLHRLLDQTTLDLVVLMGSINAVIPSPGACDYSAANAVFDAFVDSASRPAAWRQVVTVDWGAWREVGMAANLPVAEGLRSQWAEHLAGAIPPQAGVEALVRVLASRRRAVVVETYDVLRAHELMRRRAPAGAERTATQSSDGGDVRPPAERDVTVEVSTRPALSTPFEPPANDVERRLAVIWEELLGVRGIGVNDDFFELGGHSLMFTRVLALVDEGFGTKLPLREVFDASTVRLLAQRLPTANAGGGPNGEDETREVLEL
jgi:acyl transferase domain-containing protein